MTEPWPPGPREPRATAEEVHVWLADLDSPVWPGPAGLPPEDRVRAAGFLREEVGRRWVASRWVLRSLLARYLGERPEEIALGRGERGKPRLADASSRLRFNLSHSGGIALIAVCEGREVGVDVEAVEPARDLVAIAERVLEADAADAVRGAAPGDRAAIFYPAWARHEAGLKCLGLGLGSSLEGEPRPAVADLDVGAPHAAAVAVTGAEVGALRCWSAGR